MDIIEYENKFYDNLEHGEARQKGIKTALDTALESQDADSALLLYYEYIYEDTFYGNNLKAIIIFPEYVAYFEEHPELQDEHNHNLIWSFKWILGNIKDFAQIPLRQIQNLYDQYAEYCRRFHYSLRSYYSLLWNFIDQCVVKGGTFCGLTAKEAHTNMLKTARDDMTDCTACTTSDEVIYYASVEENLEMAVKKAAPLIDGTMHCKEQPHCVFSDLAFYYFREGDIENADKYATKAYRLITRDFGNSPSLIVSKSYCMLVFSYIKPLEAIKIFRRNLKHFSDNANTIDCFHFYLSGYHLFSQLNQQQEGTQVRILHEFLNEDFYNENGIYLASTLKEHFYKKALQAAEQLDQRNGNSLYHEELEKQYHVDAKHFTPYDEPLDCSYLQYIRANMEDGELPIDFSLPDPEKDADGNQYADGALDGIIRFHSEPENQELGELEEIIRLAGKGSTELAQVKTEKYLIQTGNRALKLIDKVQNFILEHSDELSAKNIFGFAVDLTVDSNHREAVKLGLSILEIFSDYNDALTQAIIDLGRCDEFTLFCVFALMRTENGNEKVFTLAKNCMGWGRIQAIDFLNPETEEIREWLLTNGIRNTVHPGYSAITVFEAAQAEQLLRKGLTQEQLTPVGLILIYLITDGPTIGIKAFENGEEIVQLYIDNAEKLRREEIDNSILKGIALEYHHPEITERIAAMGIDLTPDPEEGGTD